MKIITKPQYVNKFRFWYRRNLFAVIVAISLLISGIADAGGGLSIIRDTETENFLYDLTKPIFETANLDPKEIKIYIVGDNSLNAFVSGGQNVFINTGLITKYNKPDVLIGVLAHETGHIAAGHLARSGEEIRSATNALLLTYLVGIAAAVTASADAGSALILGGNQVMERLVLKYTRGQEEAADSLALQYLDKMQYPANGLLELLQLFGDEEASYKGQIDEYSLTHPVSRKRINFIKTHISNQKTISDKKINAALEPRMKRIIVKLEAFLGDSDSIIKKYYKNDDLSKYARVIAYFKKGKIKESLDILDEMIKANPNDGYLWELKGQILFETADIKESIPAYNQALRLQTGNKSLVKIALATAIIALDDADNALLNIAVSNLLSAKKEEQDNPEIFKQLASAYSKKNDMGNAYLSLAEYNLMINKTDKATQYAKLAKENLEPTDRPGIIQADDIIAISKKKDKK